MKTSISLSILLFCSIMTQANEPSVKWGTYYYDAINGNVQLSAIKYDGFGNIYLCGYTSDTGLGTAGTFQENLLTATGGFIAKFDTSGNRIWATYYSNVRLTDIASDDMGNIYVSGITQDSSSNWVATPGAHQPLAGSDIDALLAKFDSSGNRVWATYEGGENIDQGYSVSVSGSSVFLSGLTYSLNGITFNNGFQAFNFGGGEGFLVKYDTAGNGLWGNYCGGYGYDGKAVNCSDEQGNVYMAMGTTSTNWIATPGSYQPTKELGSDGFLIKFNTNGNRVWGTYYGGGSDDLFSSITIDPEGNICILGSSGTSSANGSTYNITTPGCYQPQPTDRRDAFIVKFTPQGERIWATYYGCTGMDTTYPHGICTDDSGNVFITFSADSAGLSTLLPVQQAFGGSGDGVIAKFDSTGNYKWGSYYGGQNNDIATSCTADGNGNVYFCGSTRSLNNIATQGSFLPVNSNDSSSGFLLRIDNAELQKAIMFTSDERIIAYPNPVSNILILESSSTGKGFLYSMDGKELFSFLFNKGKNDISMPKQLSPGIYLISCRLENGKTFGQAIVYGK